MERNNSLCTATPPLKKIGKELLFDFSEGRGGCTQSEQHVPFHSSSRRLCSCHQNQDGGTVIAVNNPEQEITCQKTRKWNMHFHPKVPAGKWDYFSKVHLFPGIFQWNAHKMCVPLTSQLKFPEFLGIKIKWKVPIVLLHLFLLQIQFVQLPLKPLPCIWGLWIQTLDLPPPPPHHRGNKENSSPWSFAS